VGEAETSRGYHRVRGNNGPDWDIPNNDVGTVSHAILERVFFVKDGCGGFKRAPKPWEHSSVIEEPKPFFAARQKINQRFNNFSRMMMQLATEHGEVSPLTDDEFLSYYGGAKLRCYEAAVLSLRETPFAAKDCWVKVFTKDEYCKPNGAPRAIQPRSPRFNVKLGRYIKHIEHEIFHAIDEIFDPSLEHKTVAKGMNMIERGNVIANMWNSYNDPVAIGLDASRFDQHINRLLLEYEHSIYHMWSTGSGDDLPPLAALLKAQIENRGVYHGKSGSIKYQVDGCRMSGDMNTSLGNVIIMTTLMHSYFESKGLLGKVKLLNDGDDCVIIMDRQHVRRFKDGLKEWFLEMGLTMEYDGTYTSLEEIEFCQSRPVYDSVHGYRLVPRPTKRLYSDLITTKNISVKKVYNKQVGAIAGCGLALSDGLPIFNSFYSWLGRGATPWVPEQGDYYYKFRQELIDGMKQGHREPTDEERISFYFAFDITPTEQVLLEQYYDSLPDPIYSKAINDPPRSLDPMQYLARPEQKDQ